MLRVFPFLDRQVALYKGLRDVSSFIVFFALWVTIFTTMYTIMGVTFDDGNNFKFDNSTSPPKFEYKTDFDDYALLTLNLVTSLA